MEHPLLDARKNVSPKSNHFPGSYVALPDVYFGHPFAPHVYQPQVWATTNPHGQHDHAAAGGANFLPMEWEETTITSNDLTINAVWLWEPLQKMAVIWVGEWWLYFRQMELHLRQIFQIVFWFKTAYLFLFQVILTWQIQRYDCLHPMVV